MLTMLALLDSDSDNDAIDEAHFQHMEILYLGYLAYRAEIEGESSDEDGGSSKDRCCNNREPSNHHPEVKWAQRLDKVYITVQLAGAKDINVKLEPEGIFNFSATMGADGNSSELTLKLHDKVNVEESKINKGVGNIFCLIEKKEQGWWRKLLSGDEETPHYVKVDWDRWVDEGHGNVGNMSALDLFSKAQPSDRTKKGKSRKMNIEAEQELQKQKLQKTSSNPVSSAHTPVLPYQCPILPPASPFNQGGSSTRAAHTPVLPYQCPILPPASPFNQGGSSTRVVPNGQLINNTLTQVRCVLESKDCSWLSSSPTDDLLQQHIVNTSLGAAAAVQLVQTIKGLNGEIKAKNDELMQVRKEAQARKAQLEEKATLLEIERSKTQRMYKQERSKLLKKFKQEKAELMKKFEQERAETKAKYEAVANDIFYQVWRNNQEGNFSFLGEEVKKVIAGFKQRLAEDTAFDNEASEVAFEKVVEELAASEVAFEKVVEELATELQVDPVSEQKIIKQPQD